MHRDLLIVGGGPVGLTLALGLAQSGLSLALLEARVATDTRRPERTLALSHGARLILERLGVWSALAAAGPLNPITRIDVSQRGALGVTQLDASESGLPALGYVTSYRALQTALEARARAAGIAIEYDARVERVQTTPAYAAVSVLQAGAARALTARLVAVADGGGENGPGGRRWRHDYRQTAIVAEVRANAASAGVAYERFTGNGPVALLPYADGYTLVWTATPAQASAIAQLDDAAFLAALHAHFGDRVGEFTQVVNRRSFPLALEVALPRSGERVVALGNAAQALHPVAGQGFNLGLRDAYELALLLRERDNAKANDACDALGSRAQLRRFANRRRMDRWAGIAFTHGVLAVFASEHSMLAVPRGIALTLLDTLPPVKRFFTRRMLDGLR